MHIGLPASSCLSHSGTMYWSMLLPGVAAADGPAAAVAAAVSSAVAASAAVSFAAVGSAAIGSAAAGSAAAGSAAVGSAAAASVATASAAAASTAADAAVAASAVAGCAMDTDMDMESAAWSARPGCAAAGIARAQTPPYGSSHVSETRARSGGMS
eukprot:6532924-Prymnesium_polylepis.1